jgi:hypothetical protein
MIETSSKVSAWRGSESIIAVGSSCSSDGERDVAVGERIPPLVP